MSFSSSTTSTVWAMDELLRGLNYRAGGGPPVTVPSRSRDNSTDRRRIGTPWRGRVFCIIGPPHRRTVMPEKSPKTRKRTSALRPEPPAPRPPAAAPHVATGSPVPSLVPRITISPEKRRLMIAEAAYYRAQSRGFRGDPVRDWTEAEAEIDAQLLN